MAAGSFAARGKRDKPALLRFGPRSQKRREAEGASRNPAKPEDSVVADFRPGPDPGRLIAILI